MSEPKATPTNQDYKPKPKEEGKKCVPVPPPIIIVGKRRGGRILPTGVVKKPKISAEEQKQPTSGYMAEVRRYQDKFCCNDEPGKRPLVK